MGDYHLMAESPLETVYKALSNRLRDPAESWGTRARVSGIKSNAGYPYVLYFWAGGGERQINGHRHAEYRVAVVCVSDKMSEAATGAGRISDLLREHGKLDDPADYLIGSADWNILTITEEDTIYLPEGTPDTITAYRWGAYYRIFMQAV
jgi:hypothetical protein